MKYLCCLVLFYSHFSLAESFPAPEVNSQSPFIETANGYRICTSWRNEEVCGNKGHCRVICRGASIVSKVITRKNLGAEVGIDIAEPICTDFCDDIPDCRTIGICDEYEYGNY